MLAGLLADSVRVWYAPHPFAQGGESFPLGAFVVRVAMNGPTVHEVVHRRAAASGADVVALSSAAADADGTDLGSGSVFPIRAPRIALVGGAPVNGNSFGFTWFAFDQRLGYPVTPVAAQSLGGARLEDFDLIVVPSVSPSGFDGALGESGKNRLADWVRNGGTLVTLDGATSGWRPKRAAWRACASGATPCAPTAPAARRSRPRCRARSRAPSRHQLAAARGRPRDIPVLVNSDRVFNPPKDLRSGEAVVRYAPLARLRLSGYLWPRCRPGSPNRCTCGPSGWAAARDRFAGDPNFRDMVRACCRCSRMRC